MIFKEKSLEDIANELYDLVKQGKHKENDAIQNPFKLLKPLFINHGSLWRG